MLKSLSIRNVVLIDKLDLDLQTGFTVLSGETGAGKSILLDSLGLLLGQRADVSMIRQGCDKLSVSGNFELNGFYSPLQKLCEEHDLELERDILISRTLSQDGRGKIFFNDQPITQKLLKEIGSCLVEIHGQFDNQGLLNPTTHLGVLDAYGNYTQDLLDIKNAYTDYKRAVSARKTAEEELAAAQTEEENIRHWLTEFSAIKPRENELSELEQKRQYMMNAEKLAENFDAAYKALNNPVQSVRESLRQAQAAVARINSITGNKYDNIYELLDTSLVNAQEAGDALASALNEVNLNRNDIDAVEERLFTLKDLARKHHTTVDELPVVWQRLEEKLQTVEHGTNELIRLRQAENKLRNTYEKQAAAIHAKRLDTARRLDENMMHELPSLKMEKARFQTQITIQNESSWSETGYDSACFMVSTNPGTPFGNLNKIASGGELSRFMLALKVNLGKSGTVETMVFDEIDTGIGGATAQAVGEKLARLGENKQVLVVTHSPQVAAHSRQHFKVEKHTADGITTTTLRQLSATEKQEEIARMLSGEIISDEARAAAKVLIGA